MAETPLSLFSLPLANMETLIATSATFQAWVGAEDAAGAKGSIAVVAEAPVPGRPFAHVDYSAGGMFSAVAVSGGPGFDYQISRSFAIRFGADISEDNEASEKDAFYEFMNEVGAIIVEILALSGNSPHPIVNSVSADEPPYFSAWVEKRADGEDYIEWAFTITTA